MLSTERLCTERLQSLALSSFRTWSWPPHRPQRAPSSLAPLRRARALWFPASALESVLVVHPSQCHISVGLNSNGAVEGPWLNATWTDLPPQARGALIPQKLVEQGKLVALTPGSDDGTLRVDHLTEGLEAWGGRAREDAVTLAFARLAERYLSTWLSIDGVRSGLGKRGLVKELSLRAMSSNVKVRRKACQYGRHMSRHVTKRNLRRNMNDTLGDGRMRRYQHQVPNKELVATLVVHHCVAFPLSNPLPFPSSALQLAPCIANMRIVGGRVYFRYGSFLQCSRKLRRLNLMVRTIQKAITKYHLQGEGLARGTPCHDVTTLPRRYGGDCSTVCAPSPSAHRERTQGRFLALRY